MIQMLSAKVSQMPPTEFSTEKGDSSIHNYSRIKCKCLQLEITKPFTTKVPVYLLIKIKIIIISPHIPRGHTKNFICMFDRCFTSSPRIFHLTTATSIPSLLTYLDLPGAIHYLEYFWVRRWTPIGEIKYICRCIDGEVIVDLRFALLLSVFRGAVLGGREPWAAREDHVQDLSDGKMPNDLPSVWPPCDVSDVWSKTPEVPNLQGYYQRTPQGLHGLNKSLRVWDKV